MKKTLLLSSIFLASVLVGCGKYASQKQAEVACKKWKDKGERIMYVNTFSAQVFPESYVTDRTCELEKETRQFLGYQGEFDSKAREKEGGSFSPNLPQLFEDMESLHPPKPSNLKVVKNFRY